MNPLTNVKNINKINEIELAKGTVDKKSWHDIYKESAWVFIGGLTYGMTEGDVICVFSQYGEIVNINLVRDQKTGKTKGFCFLCYANQKSTVLAVDNLNGIKLCGRTIRVDHVANYKPPKDNERDDEITKQLKDEGCAPKPLRMDNFSASADVPPKKESRKHKKEKKKHKKRKRENNGEFSLKKVKKEKPDPGYFKYEFPVKSESINKCIKRSDSMDSESSSDECSDTDSNHNSRKEKGPSKSRPESSRIQSDVSSSEECNKAGPSKHDRNSIKRSDYKRKGSSESSSDSGHRPRKRKLQNIKDQVNESFSERRNSKYDDYSKRRSHSCSPASERYEKHRKGHKNKPRRTEDNYKNSSSYDDSKSSYSSNRKRQEFERCRHGSSDNEDYTLHQHNSKTLNKEREKHRRNDSAEVGSTSHKNKRLENNHYSSYRDDESNGSTNQNEDRRYRERRDSRERYEHYDRSKDDQREYRCSQYGRKER